MAKIRNIVIGCDGTWNDASGSTPTNVKKMLDACSDRDQVMHYEEGVGTAHMEALSGGIYGKGLDRQILGAYRQLQKRFSDKDWGREANRVFIFGFSRGAYGARRLSGLIAFSGIPKIAADVNIGWQLYLKRDKESVKSLKNNGRFFDIPIQMLGVWDTVKTMTDDDYNDNVMVDNVVAGYHAMAIDEQRKLFPILKWNNDSRILQVWFAGVHADVGGGYPECDLSDIALRWMMERARSNGLKIVKSAVQKLSANTKGQLHDSCEGKWVVLGKHLRAVKKTELVHKSVKDRLENVPDYKPSNLPTDPNYLA